MNGASAKHVQDLFRIVESGNYQLAEKECAALRRRHSDDVNIVALHGALLLKLGRVDDAKTSLSKAIELEPRFAKPYEDLGRLHLRQGEDEKAAHRFQQAVDRGGETSAYEGLASALSRLGRHTEADKLQQHIINTSPTAAALVRAETLLNEGSLADAEKICADVLANEPNNLVALRLAARAATDAMQANVAERLLRRIVELAPGEARPLHELGRFLLEQSRFPEAIETFEQAVALGTSKGESYRFLADALSIMGDANRALESYENALNLQPDDIDVLIGRAHMLRIIGDKEAAIAAYDHCTEQQPDFGDAWWNLTSLRGHKLSEQQETVIREQLASESTNPSNRTGLGFAMARVLESHGDYEAAWASYLEGNALKRQAVQYDPVQTESAHDAILSVFDGKRVKTRSPRAATGRSPIFIVGTPRSGSTLLEQILASHSEVEGAGELPYIAMLSSSLGSQRDDGARYPDIVEEMSESQLDGIGNNYRYQASRHLYQDKPRFTDKLPANFSHVGFINAILPDASIIDARRHPLDNCVANFRQLYAQGKNYTYDLVEFAEYYLDYVRVMAHWDEVLPGRVLRVQYEDVVDDLETQVRRVLDHCDLPFEPECLEFHRNSRPVNTISAEQVREPVYRDATEVWKRYEAGLAEVREILSPIL